MTTDSEIACIVAGLSKVQRVAFDRSYQLSGPSADTLVDDPDYELWCDDLATSGGRLTPLGQAVRAALAQETGRG